MCLWVCGYVHVCERARACMCVRACVRACVQLLSCVWVFSFTHWGVNSYITVSALKLECKYACLFVFIFHYSVAFCSILMCVRACACACVVLAYVCNVCVMRHKRGIAFAIRLPFCSLMLPPHREMHGLLDQLEDYIDPLFLEMRDQMHARMDPQRPKTRAEALR